MALSPTLPAPLITPTATSGPRRTGFLSDCRDHWHWMRLELRDGCRSIRSHPGAACKTMVTHPLFAALWWFFAALYWNGVSSVVTGRTGEGTSWPLRDQGFSFPYYDNMQLSNYLLYASVAATGVRFLPIWPCCKPAIARTIFRRWLFLEGALFWFRAVSVVVTSYPRPDHNCIPTATGSVWLEAIKISFGRTYTCSDCMFSGHTAAVTLLVMFWSNYSRGEEFAVCFGQHQGIITSNVDAAGDPVGFKIIDLFLYAWALNMYYWIIATRYHYSSDVFIGFVVTWLLFHTYHLYIKSLAMQGGSLLARGMRWFEGINIATEKAIEAAAEAEATGDAQQSKPTDGTIIALRAGKEMTKENATIGGDHVPVAALPVSYLEGNNYYRAGVDTDKASLSHKDSALYDNDDVGPLPSFGVPDSAIAAARAGGPFERNTSLRRSDDDARAYTQPTPITNQAHNTDLPVAVIVTGEHAEQEQREKAREKAGEM